MSDRLYRAEQFTASDGYPSIRLVPLPEGSVVIPPDVVEAWLSGDKEDGPDAWHRVTEAFRAARGGAS